MFVIDDWEAYIERRRSAMRGVHNNTPADTLHNLMVNGVYMSDKTLASYWSIPIQDARNLIRACNLDEIVTVGQLRYYSRAQVWSVYSDYINLLRRKFPSHFRLKGTLVSGDDVAVFFEMSRTSAHRLLAALPIKTFSKNATQRSLFYSYAEIMELSRDTILFTSVKARSTACEEGQVKPTAGRKGHGGQTMRHNLRDSDCPRYKLCSDFSVRTSDYMSCSRCLHYLGRQKNPTTLPEPPIRAFAPVTWESSNNKNLWSIMAAVQEDLTKLPNHYVLP